MRSVLPHLHSCCEPAVQAQPASRAHTMALLQGTHSSALSHSLLPLCHRPSIRGWTVTTLAPSTPMRCGMPSERQVSVLLGDTSGSHTEPVNGFASLLSPRSQHCQWHSPFLTVTCCNPFAVSHIKPHPLFFILNHWYFCPCWDHCSSIWLLRALFLASLFPNLIVLFQSYAQTLFFLHFLPPLFSPLEKVPAWSSHAPMMSSLMCSLLEQSLPAKGHLEEHCFFDFSCAQWILCEWSRDRNSMNMGLNRAQCVMWAIGSAAITAIQLQCQDSLIRGLSGEHRTGYAVKQCEICSLTKCCGRTLCLSSPSTMGFAKGPQRWVCESNSPSGRNSPALQPAAAAVRGWVTSRAAAWPAVSVTPVLSPGFRLNEEVQHSIVARYACSTKLTIDFDGFVACMIRLETLFSECPGADPGSFGLALGVWCLSAVNAANCMERSGCRQNCVGESSREITKAFVSEWPWGAGDMFP